MPYGKKVAMQLTTELVQNGFIIVSGFTRGIDSICHKTAKKQIQNQLKLIPELNEENNNIYKILFHNPIHIYQL